MGVSLLAFVLFLATTGITLNHSSDFGLDRRYVSWSWLLDAYGIEAPPTSGSFADREHRATLLGDRLFLNGRDTDQRIAALSGIVVRDPLILVAGEHSAQIFTVDGDAVEIIDLSSTLPGAIERVGTAGPYAVIQSAGVLLRSDADFSVFEPWSASDEQAIAWSVATPPDAAELAALNAVWRGRGVTVERALLDLHSGRIFSVAGTLLMDFVAVCLVVLSLSGLILANQRRRGENGNKSRNSG